MESKENSADVHTEGNDQPGSNEGPRETIFLWVRLLVTANLGYVSTLLLSLLPPTGDGGWGLLGVSYVAVFGIGILLGSIAAPLDYKIAAFAFTGALGYIEYGLGSWFETVLLGSGLLLSVAVFSVLNRFHVSPGNLAAASFSGRIRHKLFVAMFLVLAVVEIVVGVGKFFAYVREENFVTPEDCLQPKGGSGNKSQCLLRLASENRDVASCFRIFREYQESFNGYYLRECLDKVLPSDESSQKEADLITMRCKEAGLSDAEFRSCIWTRCVQRNHFNYADRERLGCNSKDVPLLGF